MRLHHFVGAATLALICTPLATAAPAPALVRVRIYDNAAIGAPLAVALDDARATLLAAGVDAMWLWCRQASIGIDRPCGVPLGDLELALRVVTVTVPPGYTGRLPLGDSLIDARMKAGVLATIYYERVVWLAAQSGTPVPVLLARAIAHEIGHLLMGTREHSDAGLMRAVWKREDLERGRPIDWLFTTHDAAAIRRRVSLDAAHRQARWLPRSPFSSSAAGGSDAGLSGTLPLQ
jgi:hypothetical protein